ncbi:b(0,+)-type amino acid transporter 1 [Coelomomyces lativittatus]|nr:b(0,+)-type amino acid transporter 1 [Coelomomyces lativittatus]
MIGVGVFVTGSNILQSVGSPGMAMLIWTLGAFVALCGGFSYTEWSLMLPQNGGDISYLDCAYPSPPQFFSFLYCWCRVLLINPAYVASMSILAGDYLYRTFDPDVSSSIPPYGQIDWIKKAISFVFLSCLFLLCAFSNVIATRASTIITGLKLVIVGFVLVSAILAVSIGFGDFTNPLTFTNAFLNTNTDPSKYANALFLVFFAYDGWANLSMVIDELQNPSRNISRAIIFSVCGVACIYLSVNLAFFGVLSASDMKSLGDAPILAIRFAERVYGSAIAGRVMAVLIMISAFGAGLCMAFGTARVGQYAGQQRMLPFSSFLGQSHPRFQTPFNSLVVNCSIAAFMVLVPPSTVFFDLVAVAMFGVWVFYGITLAGLIKLRFTQPDRPRPFRVFLLCPILVVLTAIFLTIVPFTDTKRDDGSMGKWYLPLTGLVLILLGVPVYFATLHRRFKRN